MKNKSSSFKIRGIKCWIDCRQRHSGTTNKRKDRLPTKTFGNDGRKKRGIKCLIGSRQRHSGTTNKRKDRLPTETFGNDKKESIYNL